MASLHWVDTVDPSLLEIAQQHSRMVECAIVSGEPAKAHAAVDAAFVAVRAVNAISLDSPLESILIGRISTILRGGGIHTVKDLLHHTRDSLKQIQQIRYKSIDLIEEKLANHGLSLRRTSA
jgi:hypothetical protein